MCVMPAEYVYFGNLFPNEPQYKSGKFCGLALTPRFDRDIPHDARSPMQFEAGSISGFQSQDVFEHIEFEKIPAILDDIYRCLRPGGLFRLSVPDYRSPLLKERSVYDHKGRVVLDTFMGGSVGPGPDGKLQVRMPTDGRAHLWHPTVETVREAILASDIRKCSTIDFLHYWKSDDEWVAKPIDQSLMPVSRIPPHDMRADGRPISLVVDFIK